MKRIIIAVLCASLVWTSVGCYGSFKLTEKVYKWNGSVNDKLPRTLVFWAFVIVPVYSACMFIDGIVFNVIEFWSGNNPLAFSGDTDTHKIVVSANKLYDITMGRKTITILETRGPDAGKKISLTYKEDQSAWYLTADMKTVMIAAFDPPPLGKVTLIGPDGVTQTKDIAYGGPTR